MSKFKVGDIVRQNTTTFGGYYPNKEGYKVVGVYVGGCSQLEKIIIEVIPGPNLHVYSCDFSLVCHGNNTTLVSRRAKQFNEQQGSVYDSTV